MSSWIERLKEKRREERLKEAVERLQEAVEQNRLAGL